MKRAFCELLLVAYGLFLSTSTANASLITYEFSGIASGNLNFVHFDDKEFMITLIGDTSAVTKQGDVFYNTASSVTFSIADVGSGTFLWAYQMFSTDVLSSKPVGINQGIGFQQQPPLISDRVTIYVHSTTLYDLASSLGPISTDSSLVGQFRYDATTAGQLNLFVSVDDNLPVVTFQAHVSAVPEPSSFALLVIGGIGLAIGAYRRCQMTAVSANWLFYPNG